MNRRSSKSAKKGAIQTGEARAADGVRSKGDLAAVRITAHAHVRAIQITEVSSHAPQRGILIKCDGQCRQLRGKDRRDQRGAG